MRSAPPADSPILDGGVLRSVVFPQRTHWDSPVYLAMCSELGFPPHMARRVWEYVIVSLIMRSLPRTCTALGTAVSNEPMIGIAEKHFNRVIVSDLWEPQWDVLPNRAGATTAYQVVADAMRLPILSGSIDVLWCVSSIEHFHQTPHVLSRVSRRVKRTASKWGWPTPWRRGPAKQALREAQRVLSPRGIAIISTEVVVAGRTPAEFFELQEFMGLASQAGLGPRTAQCDARTDAYFLDHVVDQQAVCGWPRPEVHVYLRDAGTVYSPAVFVLKPA